MRSRSFIASTSRCRYYSSTSTPSAARPCLAHLSHRSVLEISGPDAQKFLKGLTSRDVEPTHGGYSGFLNASGRVLHAVFIIPVEKARVPTYLVIHETPEDHPAPLLTTLPPFKLRSKVKIRDATPDWDVWSVWGTEYGQPSPARTFKLGSGGAAEATWTWQDYRSLGLADGEIGCWDLRAGFGIDALGRQVLVPKGRSPSLTADADIVPFEDYHLRRMTLGVPEGPGEIIPGSALPLESCMDVHGGVDFRKGCYLGQELTVRTYHTGATRKRILPIRLQTPPPAALGSGLDITYHPPSSAASQRPKSAGRLLSLHPAATQVGLGLVRLEMAERSCWQTDDPGKLTVNMDGVEYGVEVGKGEAFGAYA